jgi:hypothetical protein
VKISKRIERSILFSDIWIEFSLIFLSFFLSRFGWGFIDGMREASMHVHH